MKIHSNFKDYYDVGLKYSTDNEPVYIRNSLRKESHQNLYIYKLNNEPLYRGMIFFCNEYFPFVQIRKNDILSTFYSAKEFNNSHKLDDDEVIKRIFDPDFVARWQKSGENEYHRMRSRLDLFRSNVPIALVCYTVDHRIEIINPFIKPYQFHKVYDPITAFHKLHTFLCNIARPENPTIEIDDKSLAKSKGYDKWSFRKMSKNSKE